MEFYENKAKSQSESGQMKKMLRTAIVNFEMFYKVEFTCAIMGHHVYKTSWTPVLNEKLECKKDNREEALSHDKHSVRVFKRDETLVGHVPIEVRIIDYFMQNNEKTLFQQRLLDQEEERSDSLFWQNFQLTQLIEE